MKHVSIDLETAATTPYAAIFAIGAVFFDPATGEIGETFRVNVDGKSAIAYGGEVDDDTMAWWQEQSEDARAALLFPLPVSLPDALSQFSQFIHKNTTADDTRDTMVWGNGIRSDNVWLSSAYDKARMVCPWGFWADGDVRTMVMLGRSLGIDPKHDIVFEGTQHNPLDDAIHQAKYVSAIWQHIHAK